MAIGFCGAKWFSKPLAPHLIFNPTPSKIKKVKKIPYKNILLVFLLASIALLFLIFVATSVYIGHSVGTTCIKAKDKYKNNCVDSLIATLKDTKNSYQERNSAIWALGQLGDKKALPALLSFYTGNIPDREPLNETVSQYELNKAINLTAGGVNLSAVVWRIFLKP